MMKSWRSLKALAAGVTLVAGIGLLMGADEKPADDKAAAEKAGPTAGESFKNIQVLKDLPADQLMPTMQRFNQALGVRCNFCHVPEDFSKDDKPEKKTARAMILMVQRVNKNEPAVDNHLTCFMCHHAHAHPAGSPEAEKRMNDRAAEKSGEGKPAEGGDKPKDAPGDDKK